MQHKIISDPRAVRANPRFRHFYQSLADVIRISWEFHKERVQTGQTSFAYPAYDVIANEESGDTYKPITMFGEAVHASMTQSLLDFFDGLKTAQANNGGEKFTHPYVQNLVTNTWKEGKSFARVFSNRRKEYSVLYGINSGAHTATDVTARLAALFGEDFDPVDAVRASKIRLEDLWYIGRGLGEPAQYTPGITYYLLHPAQRLNMEMLKELGYGEAMGCPASIPISAQTKAYLRTECGIDVKGTMLEDFAGVVKNEFDTTVRASFEALAESKRQFIDEQERLVLEGKIWEGIKDGSVESGQGCPFSMERER